MRPALRAVLTWLVGFYAYMVLLVDELPLGTEGGAVHLSIRESGRPTVASTLMRWLTSLPSALVLGVLAIVSGLFAFLGAISILASATQPASVLRLQRAVIVWQARLLAYHASLVEEYPPFHLDVGTDQAGPIATQP